MNTSFELKVSEENLKETADNMQQICSKKIEFNGNEYEFVLVAIESISYKIGDKIIEGFEKLEDDFFEQLILDASAIEKFATNEYRIIVYCNGKAFLDDSYPYSRECFEQLEEDSFTKNMIQLSQAHPFAVSIEDRTKSHFEELINNKISKLFNIELSVESKDNIDKNIEDIDIEDVYIENIENIDVEDSLEDELDSYEPDLNDIF